MKLKDMKIKAFSLIEEYYPNASGLAEDEDVLNKINGVINQIQMDLMKYKKIPAKKEIEIESDDNKEFDLKDKIDDLYQINTIHIDKDIDYEIVDNYLILPDDYVGTIKVYYYKYPELVKITFEDTTARNNYDNSYEFELDDEILEIMPYGIAADLLKMDMISNYGQYFNTRYLEMKNQIDSRRSAGKCRIVGGVDV